MSIQWPPQIQELRDASDTRAAVWAICYGPDGRGRIHRTCSVLAMFEGAPFLALLARKGWRLVSEPGRRPYYICPHCAGKRARKA